MDSCEIVFASLRPRQRHETTDDENGKSVPDSGKSAAPIIDKRKNYVKLILNAGSFL